MTSDTDTNFMQLPIGGKHLMQRNKNLAQLRDAEWFAWLS